MNADTLSTPPSVHQPAQDVGDGTGDKQQWYTIFAETVRQPGFDFRFLFASQLDQAGLAERW
jgi:hypothetical protein